MYDILIMSVNMCTSASITVLMELNNEDTYCQRYVKASLIFIITWLRYQMETFSAVLPFVRGIHRSLVNCPHKGQWRGALMFSLICSWISGWVNNREAGDLKRHRAHYDVVAMIRVSMACRRLFRPKALSIFLCLLPVFHFILRNGKAN